MGSETGERGGGWARYRRDVPCQVPGLRSVGAGLKSGEKIPTPQYLYPLTAVMANQSNDLVHAGCKAFNVTMDDIVEKEVGLVVD